MPKQDRKKLSAEWKSIMKDHPEFAKAMLAQQTILMELSQMGFKIVDMRICLLLRADLPVIFHDYWKTRCNPEYVQFDPGGVIGCLTSSNRDPAGCFSSDDTIDWFDDPFAGGRVFPPKPGPGPKIKPM